ncbi:Ribonuclease H domain [Arabidopsis thaliana x Arabidopsis arenosa]|uniref:Ribonuclease H domain n=1 Tax=Arabidopsis thaliana x Arabidopsis arenosa TaxID=1240361 RepID=A0A8T1ZKH8_9BRAS|nr:Ribonuclease H domain [Arabidopsis thaliana x Arabidopsis arenosa]
MGFISDRLKARLSGWYEKTLSLGGKEVLLKSVAMALPVYAMSCFRLTKYQCQQITSAMAQFWWNETEDKNKMHWVSWEKMCKPKARGGLGFRDIGRFNQALLAKQAWRLLDSPTSLVSQVYKAKYFANKTLLEAKICYRPSYTWRSIMFGRELLERGLMKSIGDGKDTSIWVDKWIADDFPRRPINKHLMIDLNLKVSSLITSQGDWNIQLLNEFFPPCDVIKIRSFPPEMSLRDKHVWAYTKDSSYTVKSGNWVLTREAEMMEITPGNIQEINKIKDQTVYDNMVCKWLSFVHSVKEKTKPFPMSCFGVFWHHGFGLCPLYHCRIRVSLHQSQSRNSTLYAAKVNDPHIIIATALEEMEEWTTLNHNTNLETAEEASRGGRQVLRNHIGNVLFHARDAFLPRMNRLSAELHCLLWCLRSLHDLHINNCEIWSDCNAAVMALEKPLEWPKYRSQLDKILQAIRVMGEVSFHLSSPKANTLARDIACSVTKEGRFTSYLALGGPSWLHDRIERERAASG